MTRYEQIVESVPNCSKEMLITILMNECSNIMGDLCIDCRKCLFHTLESTEEWLNEEVKE